MPPPKPTPTPTSRGNTGAWLVLIGVFIAAALAVVKGIKTRFEAGDTYPPYSSLRSDPVGSRALFEALEITPRLKVERNYRSLEFIKGQPGDVLVLAGLSAGGWNMPQNRHEMDAIVRFMEDGGRLIVALNPVVHYTGMRGTIHQALDELDEEDSREKKTDKSDATDKSDKKPIKPPTAAEREERELHEKKRPMSFAEALRLAAKSKTWSPADKETKGSPLTALPAMKLSAQDLPGWRSNTHLDDDPRHDWEASPEVLAGEDDGKTDERIAKRLKTKRAREAELEAAARFSGPPERSRWTQLATKGDRTMIAQLAVGKGSVLVCTDRFFLSNEALWADEGAEVKPAFLSWLLGDAKRIIFDETSLSQGIGDEDGIMTLARKHGMHGLFLGGILLFGLYIWRNAFSLVPPNPDDDLGIKRGEAVAGRGAASGLEGLLRRGVKAKELLRRCLDTWNSTRSVAHSIPADRRAAAAAALANPESAKDPVSTYRAIRDALHPPRN
jgi:hypothetical protein